MLASAQALTTECWGKGTAEKMYLQTTAENSQDGADVTWCSSVFSITTCLSRFLPPGNFYY